jgi:hypothetical protein
MATLRKTRERINSAVDDSFYQTWQTHELYSQLMIKLGPIKADFDHWVLTIGDEEDRRKMQERFQGYLSRAMRKVLLTLLQKLIDRELEAATLEPFFSFGVLCVHRGYLSKKDILDLFEDLFECCPEQKLEQLFPLFENSVLGPTSSVSLKSSLGDRC